MSARTKQVPQEVIHYDSGHLQITFTCTKVALIPLYSNSRHGILLSYFKQSLIVRAPLRG